jgi:hypothetical protein
MHRSSLVPLLLAASLGCSSTEDRPPSGPPGRDGGVTDTGLGDGGPGDVGPGDGGSDPDGGVAIGPELVECPTGSTLVQWSLTPISPIPPASALELTGLPNGADVMSAGVGISYSARFDLCRNASGEHTIHGVIWALDDFSAPSYYVVDPTVSTVVEDFIEYRGGFVYYQRVPPSAWRVTGLAEALAGNLGPFELRIVDDSGLLVVGHAGFLAGVTADVRASSINYTNLWVIVGGLAPGDVFATRPCPFGQNKYERTWRMSTADFAIEACSYLGGGHTTAYDITRLAITDTNAELTAAEQQTHVFEGAAAVEAVLNYQWNHHNACDSFHLALPHADYAATTAPLAGCGIPVANAPPRSFDDDPNGPVEFRIRYHGGAWTDGTMPNCTHYLFCQQ